MSSKVQHNKGKIRDNALKALVKSDLFRHKVERKRKGKGSYNRQEAKKWRDGFDTVPPFLCLKRGSSRRSRRSLLHWGFRI
ncbi:alternative ribosome-rescue factor A [Neisseria sp. oral taxon 014]|nr:alternative ribosome-rescue factor A [Neisseria sp. oral taxon 014]